MSKTAGISLNNIQYVRFLTVEFKLYYSLKFSDKIPHSTIVASMVSTPYRFELYNTNISFYPSCYPLMRGALLYLRTDIIAGAFVHTVYKRVLRLFFLFSKTAGGALWGRRTKDYLYSHGFLRYIAERGHPGLSASNICVSIKNTYMHYAWTCFKFGKVTGFAGFSFKLHTFPYIC